MDEVTLDQAELERIYCDNDDNYGNYCSFEANLGNEALEAQPEISTSEILISTPMGRLSNESVWSSKKKKRSRKLLNTDEDNEIADDVAKYATVVHSNDHCDLNINSQYLGSDDDVFNEQEFMEFVEKNLEVRGAQYILQRNNSNLKSSYYMNSEHDKIKQSLDAAFKLKLSTSMIIIDPTNCAKTLLVDEVLRSYNLESSHNFNTSRSINKSYIACVDGLLVEQDWDALVSLADQFLVRKRNEGQFMLALEDLETHFKQCKVEGKPAVIVLEEFHVFAAKRQTLIYTLLDLMHRKDLLFIMIGITGHADVHFKLEKRIVSRLNAKYIFMSYASAEDIAREMYGRLIIPKQHHQHQQGDGEQSASSSGKSDDRVCHVSDEYRIQFNKHIIAMFGEYKDSHLNIDCDLAEINPMLPSAKKNCNESRKSSPSKRVKLGDMGAMESPKASRNCSQEDDTAAFSQTSSVGSSASMRTRRSTTISNSATNTPQPSTSRTSAKLTSTENVDRNDSNEVVLLASPRSTRSGKAGVSPLPSLSNTMKLSQNSKTNSKSNSRQSSPTPKSPGRHGNNMDRKSAIELTYERQVAAVLENELAERRAKQEQEAKCQTLLKPGNMIDIIRIRREWGQGIDYFTALVHKVIVMLTAETPYVTRELFLDAMDQSEPLSLVEQLNAMSRLELMLLAALTYLHLHKKSVHYFTVGQMVGEYDKLTGAIRDKKVSKICIAEALYHLCADQLISLYNHQSRQTVLQIGADCITSQTVVFLAESPIDIQRAFLDEKTDIVEHGFGLPQPSVQIPSRLRNLLKKPFLVNLYTANTEHSNASSYVMDEGD